MQGGEETGKRTNYRLLETNRAVRLKVRQKSIMGASFKP
jgi:hypothetical protein